MLRRSLGRESLVQAFRRAQDQRCCLAGLECSANTVEDRCEDQELTAEELRRQKRRKINRESARRMRMKPRKEVEEQKTLISTLAPYTSYSPRSLRTHSTWKCIPADEFSCLLL